MLPVTVVHNGKIGVIMESVKKTYKVYPGLVRDKLLPECILDSYSIDDVVTTILKDSEGFTSDSECANLGYCSFNSFVYHLYLSLSLFLILSFGGFYQLILDTVSVKEGD
mgnify:CR=1 FL=1